MTSPVSSSLPQHLSTRSPRSSIDSSPRTPNSPFLQSLSNRFRKGSNASTFSVSSDPPTQPQDTAGTAQSAKRYILSVIRNDWEWPPPQPHTVSGGENVTEDEEKQDSMLTQRDAVGWRTRHEGASDLDLDLSPVTSTGRRRSKRNSDPYKFESPDAIASVIQEQRLKRRRENLDETIWNEGLRTWSERRDAWTAAQRHKPQRRSFTEADGNHRGFSGSRLHHKQSVSSEESKQSGSTQESNTLVVEGNSVTGQALSTSKNVGNTHNGDGVDDLNGPYLPIYPPLFPTSHTLRARIRPAAYPTIYSKVVLQSLTPNVPIPLTHMIGALVDGWKAEGNWPPQTLQEQQTHALLKRAKGATKGESAFQKWRKERDAERRQSQAEGIFEDGFADELIDSDERKKGFRRSISGAVKKVLGIHPEEEEDGGLAKLGLSFATAEDDDGLMRESQRVADANVALNKGLLDDEKT